jgi:cation diffusion facilitator family transporter
MDRQHSHGEHEHDHHEHDHHDHDHEHTHHDHDSHSHHDHSHGSGLGAMIREAIPFLHGHTHGPVEIDTALEANQRGMWAVKVSLTVLLITALLQVFVVAISGSVGLLADTIHNFSDALTAVPLGIAFLLGRRAATRRYTYGYGRAEDIAGVIIVLMILGSALVAGYESYQKFVHPQVLENVTWVMAASIIGFLGNEAVAVFRIRVGREIGSAALVADGQHARTDGFTSLAVFLGALGSVLGFPIADPIVGFLITIAILFIVKDTIVAMWFRLMDAVDPALVDSLETAAQNVSGVEKVDNVRVRWLGHRLLAEMHITVNEDLPTRASHLIAEEVRHALFHVQPKLVEVTVHIDPCGHCGQNPHEVTAHHKELTPAAH